MTQDLALPETSSSVCIHMIACSDHKEKIYCSAFKMIHYVFIVVVQSILPFPVTQTVFILFVVTVLQKREHIKEYIVKRDFILACTFTLLSVCYCTIYTF